MCPLHPLPFAEQEEATITVARVDEDDDDIDHDFIARRQAEVAKMGYVRTLAESRNLMAHTSGSFAELIIQERGNGCDDGGNAYHGRPVSRA